MDFDATFMNWNLDDNMEATSIVRPIIDITDILKCHAILNVKINKLLTGQYY